MSFEMLFFLEIPRYLKKKKTTSDFTFTKAYLYATVGKILFFKPYQTTSWTFSLKLTLFIDPHESHGELSLNM